MFDIITIGAATRDITFLTDQGKMIETPEDLTSQRLLAFEYGAKIRSEEVRMSFGGGACNAAATLAKMGLKVAMISRVGNDANGKSILENLSRRNIDGGLIQTDNDRVSAFSFIVVDSAGGEGERVIFSHKGAANHLEIRSEEIKNTGWVYLTGLGDIWEEGLEKISVAIETNGVKLAWNPGSTEIVGGKEKIIGLVAHTDIFIINKDEAIELIKSDSGNGFSDEDYNDIYKLIKVIKSWGAKNVVITDGKNGAILFTGTEMLKISAFVQAQTDTTGAGDAFGSGLLAGYVISGNFETALRYAALNSGGEVSDFGAESGIMTREEVESRLDEIEIQRVNP